MKKADFRYSHFIIALMTIASLGFSSLNINPTKNTPQYTPSLSFEDETPKNTEEDGGTPLQLTLRRAIEERRSEGLPTPASTSYEYEVTTEPAQFTPRAEADIPNSSSTTGTTVIEFDLPQQAGYDQWPNLIVEEGMPNGALGSVQPGDYTQTIRDALEETYPGIWQQYEFGYEPRRYTFEETFKIIYPDSSPEPLPITLAEHPQSTMSEDIILGFTYSGPQIDYTISFKEEACFKIFGKKHCMTIAEAKAGFQLDWAFGVRLPMKMSVNLPDVMAQGCSYWPTSTILPMDWEAEQFRLAGVPRYEEGKEFLLSYDFFVGVKASILGKPVVTWCIEAEYDASKSFRTPFGPDGTFELPEVYLPPDLTGLRYPLNIKGVPIGSIGIGLGITPKLGSDKLTASWQVLPGGDASGFGKILLKQSEAPVAFGPIDAGDFSPVDYAQVQLSGFRYWFTRFLIKLSATIELELFQFGHWTSPPIDIIDAIDLSRFGLTKGLWVGPHNGTGDAIVATIPVQPPIELGEDQRTNEDETVSLTSATFVACSMSDPTNATINWGDGSPIESGAIVWEGSWGTIAGSHVYGDNGLYSVEICISDDKGWSACDTMQVTVLNLAPTVEAGPSQTIVEGQNLLLELNSFTDPGFLDSHSLNIDWGDGTPIEQGLVAESMGAGFVSGSHAYGDDGTYEVTLNLCDDDDGCGQDRFQVIVENSAPNVKLDRSGLKSFGDDDAFLERVGVEQSHQALASDSGSDDLIFLWNFGFSPMYYNDGTGPDPLSSSSGVFPFQVIDSAQVTFDSPGIHAVMIEVVDDDRATSQDSLPVLVTDNKDLVQGRSYWLNQFSGVGETQIDQATLQAYLDLVNFSSKFFSERKSVKTIEEARQTLAINNRKIRSTVEASLLVAWLNFAQGAIVWEQKIDANRDCRGDTPFYEVMKKIEATLLRPSLNNIELIRTRILVETLKLDNNGKPTNCIPMPRLK